jgi:UDP-glucose 4-epimerase
VNERSFITRSIAITGAAGFVGRALLRRLARERGGIERILALDVREVPAADRLEGVDYAVADVRDPKFTDRLTIGGVDAVVHLASIVSPGPDSTREMQHAVDVGGTRNVLEACATAGVSYLVVTTSGAAYGFHADNPEWLREGCALRGNEEFAYAHHKRLVEEMLAEWRERRPELRQLVLRPGAIVGPGMKNPISDLLAKPVILGVRGAASPFCFVSEEDVAACIALGLRERRDGVFNVAGDGAMTLREVAARTGKRFLPLPAGPLRLALGVLKRAGLTQYGPEQVAFLQHRSALANDALKERFGYVPALSARGAFERWWAGMNERSFIAASA